MPERATAAPFGTINALSLAGHRADGSRWVMFSFFGGGLGGNPESDGLSHANNPISTATIPPAEILEAAYPVMFTQWALRPDSGRRRDASRRTGRRLRDRSAGGSRAPTLLLGERGKYPPFGVDRRRSGRAEPVLLGAAGRREHAAACLQGRRVRIRAGERVRLETPGGGGWGDPRERDRRSVARDVRLGYVGAAARAKIYEVVLAATAAPSEQPTARVIGTTREGADVRSSASTSAAPSPTSSASTKAAGASPPPRCRRIAATRRAGSWTGSAPLGEISALASIVHGTTVGTNALLERKGARIGLITTSGFSRRDRDAPARPAQHLGSVGRFRAGRGSRPETRGRRAHPGRRRDPRRG